MTKQENLDLCKEFLGKARAIVQRESMFEIRGRYNSHHSPEQKKEEEDLHNTHQQEAWAIVKDIYVNNRDAIILWRQHTPFQSDKDTIDAIIRVIDNEIDEILLED